MVDRRYHVASGLIGMTSSLLTLLQSHFNPAEAPLRFHKKETRYFKASDLASFGKSENKTTLSKPAPCLLGFGCFPAALGIV